MTVEYPPAGRAWYMVILLTALYMLSFLDRTIIVLLVEPIKADLGLTDTELSLLYGLAFAVFYTFLGIPIARLADRKSRRVIIMVGVSIWSLATAICGLAKNFGQLFAARVSVGVGEASLSPAAYSMISDSFPTEQRAVAMSVYTMGLYLGVGFALILGGVVIDWVGEGTLTEVPVLGLLSPWQLTFMIVGMPGLLLALVMLTVTEPARRQSTAETTNISLADAFKWFAVRWRFFIVFWLALTCLVFHSYSFSAWTPSFFIRTFNWTAVEVSRYYGVAVLIFGPTGILFGGLLATRLLKRGNNLINVQMVRMAFILLLVPAGLATLVDNAWLALFLIALIKFISGLPLGVAVAAFHEITPNALRAQATALYMFTINLIGLGLGPTSVALITDYVFHDAAQLRYSMAIVGVVIALIGLILAVYAVRQYPSYRGDLYDSKIEN